MTDELYDFSPEERRKFHRSRRRELEATLESGHLKVWFSDMWLRHEECGKRAYRQWIRACRHSCHAPCCTIRHYEAQLVNKRERRQVKAALRHLDLFDDIDGRFRERLPYLD